MDLELGVDGTGVQGPVSRRLQEVGPVIPLVFGGFAEVSEGVHTMVDLLAKSRLRKEGMSTGNDASKRRLGEVVGQIRRVVPGNSKGKHGVHVVQAESDGRRCIGGREAETVAEERRRSHAQGAPSCLASEDLRTQYCEKGKVLAGLEAVPCDL